jgi:hypothetical protein
VNININININTLHKGDYDNDNNNSNKHLTIELQRMWNVKTKVITVTMGATGTISKSFRKCVSNIPGNMKSRTTENSHIRHCTHTSESANVKVQ